MRYHKDHKAQTRATVIKNASSRFRRDGINAVGIASLMADTGLTHGGFYAHFTSKEELVGTALGSAFEETIALLATAIESSDNKPPVEALIAAYLTPQHRDHPEHGCAAAALGSEVARMGTITREEFSRHIKKLVDLIDRQLDQSLDNDIRNQVAAGIFATLVGALQLSRAVKDPAQSLAFIEAGKAAAIAIARPYARS